MPKFPIEVGQTVYLNPTGNQAFRSDEVRKHVIKSIGRKYFVTWDGEAGSAVKFELDTFREVTKYTAHWIIHETEQEIYDAREYERLWNCLAHKTFTAVTGRGSHLTLDQLKRIEAIVQEGVQNS